MATKTGDAGGRPTKFQPAYAEQARKLAMLGLSDAKIAEFFAVAESTLHLWKTRHGEFSECLAAGKVQADADVAAALYRTALGGAKVTELREEPDSEGNIIRKRVIRELAPHFGAQKYLLACRHPDKWRESLRFEDVTPPEQLVETAMRFDELMAAARERQRRVLIERGILPPRE
ncbi:hypothetical protein E4582_09885 [Luteimonas yindakuii]|uniref:Terminase n=1 Tax=Luteimonas yindakuii TaxID=2565782 RepID=A0A4Z1R6G6_9GAMM|nr:hypothetical protein [Luteimonas yindakuii]TKS55040.1 hypothetical protein E4582_09885 [Luteimonas yindakuii]